MKIHPLLVTISISGSLCVSGVLANNDDRQPSKHWVYSDYDDAATGLRRHEARRIAPEGVDTSVGKVGGRFILQGTSLKTIVEFDLLQSKINQKIDCPQGACAIIFKFDDQPPVEMTATVLPGPYSELNITDGNALAVALEHASTTDVTFNIKDDEARTLRFYTADLDWPRDTK